MKKQPVSKNDKLVVEIMDLTHEGMGVAKIEGFPLFIENTLPGEKAEILVVKVGKKFGYGKLIELIEKSSDRIELENDTLIRTGIAPLLHMNYASQLAFKENQVKNAMERIGKIEDVTVLPIKGMENPVAYRNKAQIPVRKINGKLETGFYRKNSHDLVPLEDFLIQDKRIDEAIVIVRDIMRKYNVKAYNEEEHTGNLRHIIIRRGHYSKEIMVVLVTRTEKLFNYEKMVMDIMAQLPEVVSVIQNINSEKTNVILGKHNKTLFEQDYLADDLLGQTYRISAQSFYQVNTVQAEELYRTAIEFADLSKEDVVIDAYCGIGTIGLSLASKVKQVYGLEVVPEAIVDAKVNAKLNEIENITFEVGKAEYVLPEWKEKDIEPTVIIVDPPRKGLTDTFIKTSVEMNPDRIVYVSCNPSSLARDCKLYDELGYKVEKVQPVDMFPQTAHVESVTLLVRQ